MASTDTRIPPLTEEQLVDGFAARVLRQVEAWEKHAQEAHGYDPGGAADMRFKYDRSVYATHIECRTGRCKWRLEDQQP